MVHVGPEIFLPHEGYRIVLSKMMRLGNMISAHAVSESRARSQAPRNAPLGVERLDE